MTMVLNLTTWSTATPATATASAVSTSSHPYSACRFYKKQLLLYRIRQCSNDIVAYALS